LSIQGIRQNMMLFSMFFGNQSLRGSHEQISLTRHASFDQVQEEVGTRHQSSLF